MPSNDVYGPAVDRNDPSEAQERDGWCGYAHVYKNLKDTRPQKAMEKVKTVI